MDNTSKGFAHIILILVVVIVAIGGVGYLMFQNGQLKQQVNEPENHEKVEPKNSSNNSFSDPTTDWNTYTNNNFGFSIKYPVAFEKQGGDTENVLIRFSGGEKGEVTIEAGPYSIEHECYEIGESEINSADIKIKKETILYYGGGNCFISSLDYWHVEQATIETNKGNIYIIFRNPLYSENNRNNATILFEQILSTFEFTDDNYVFASSYSPEGKKFTLDTPDECTIKIQEHYYVGYIGKIIECSKENFTLSINPQDAGRGLPNTFIDFSEGTKQLGNYSWDYRFWLWEGNESSFSYSKTFENSGVYYLITATLKPHSKAGWDYLDSILSTFEFAD